MTTPATKSQWAPLVTGLGVAVISTGGLLYSALLDRGAGAAETTFERVTALEERADALTRANAELSVTLAKLQIKLEQAPDQMEALRRYLSGLDRPAWIKVYEPDRDRFVMLYLNHAYAVAYGVSRALYIGRTDFEIYPYQVARRYHENDSNVLAQKNFQEFAEPIKQRGGAASYTLFWKSYFKLPDGREAVAGIQVGIIGGDGTGLLNGKENGTISNDAE